MEPTIFRIHFDIAAGRCGRGGSSVTTVGVLVDQNRRPINSDWRACSSAAFEWLSDATTAKK